MADFAPSLATGTAAYDIAIAVPPASAGFGPKLSLAYDSGGGVTEIGIGWRVAGTAKIRRRVENGLPRFDDADAFELVGIGIPSDFLEVSPRTFRPAVEDGAFVRVERSEDGTAWEARTKAGVTMQFGGEGFVEAEGDHVSAYLLREEADHHGHRIAYEWDATEGHALLTHVVWNDFDATARNEVRLSYEDRPDHHRRFSSGIRETITRRLHAVEVDHGGALVRRYELGYGDGAHPVLETLDLVGRDATSRLPASRFEYTDAKLAVGPPQLVTMQDAPGRSPKDPDATLADLDGDGLPDLLVAKAGAFRSYLNHDGKRWLPPSDWGSASPSVSLSAKGVQLADYDADGAPDLVVKSGTDDFRYFPRPTATSFGDAVAIATVPNFTFEDADVRLADMDGDRRTDVVITTEAGIAVGYNRGGTDFTLPAVVGQVDGAEKVRFSLGTSLCDVNGDRVEDLCSLRSGGMAYWLGRGRGEFEPGESAVGVPEWDASAPYQLVDLNGDGWVDLLRVGVESASVALATAEGRFAPVQTIEGTPERNPDTAIELVDMNASGTTDIVWVDVAGDASASWRYLELFPDGRSGLLRRIDDGLGKVQTIDYEPAALHAARARDAGKPWSTRMNVAMPVVARLTADLSLGDPAVVTELSYRNGTYDPVERTFAGFGGGTRKQIGDAWTPTLFTESTFDTGLVRRELRGVGLTEESRDEAGHVFSRSTRTYTSRELDAPSGGRAVSYSFESAERVEHIEGDEAHARTTLTEFDQDGYGNVTEERRWGEILGNDTSTGNDEALLSRTFVNDPAEWLLGHVATEELTDPNLRRISFSRKYYDGAPFEGLPLGQVTRGDVSREEAWVGPAQDAFELVIATSYDSDGLPVETRDGRGGGRFFTWAADHTAIASERVKLDSRVALVETAVIDGAFGALLSATDYAGQTTSYEYDAFGRLTKIVKPGDSGLLPTVAYSYDERAPLSRIATESRVRSGHPEVERSETLVDGGGRERGTLTRDGDRWILAGVSLFDARGSARRTLLPRAVDDTAHTLPPLLDGSPRGTDVHRDALGRDIRTRAQSGIEARTEYAPFETRHWDGGQADPASPYEHTPTIERKDGLGRVVAHQRTLGGAELIATYTYDARGALLSRTDPEKHASTYEYDGRGRRIAVHDPDLGDHRLAYDTTGNIIARTYADGVTARFSFDLAGRSLTEDFDGDGKAELSRLWDVAPDGKADALYRGKLSRVSELSGSVEHTYDERGRVTTTRYEIDGTTYAVGSQYDAQDREIVHAYPDASSIEIRRNARGQIAGYGRAIDFTYGGDGLETERRFNTGVVATSGYDEDRRRTELTVTGAGGSIIEHLRWNYDGGGNLTDLRDLRDAPPEDRDRSETYVYDNLYRLGSVEGVWGKTSYRYSSSGNLTSRASTIASQSVESIGYAERPHAPTAFDGHAIALDARGRMTTDGSRTYSWNEADQLTQVSRADGEAEENTYGDDGVRRLRVEHHAGVTTTTHFIDDWSESRDGKLVRYIVHGGQRIVKLGDATGIVASGAAAESPGAARPKQTSHDARAASAPTFGLLCVFAFALTVVTRKISRIRPRDALQALRAACLAGLVGVGLFVVGTSATPGATAMGIALVMALCMARSAPVARATRVLVASAGVLFLVAACGGEHDRDSASTDPHGSIEELGESDTLIVTDLLGSVLAETSGTGAPKSVLATYPFGAPRYDTSAATWKYAGTPRDGVGLDHMGARFYAPNLGTWTSGDPIALTDPERLVTSDFAAANPYAYAKQSPLLSADRNGHFWNIAIGAAVGALVGGAVEAGRQYIAHGRVDDWGRVGSAALGGAVSGTIMALNPAAGLASAMGVGAASNVGAGLAERLVASGGKDAGTLRDVAIDAGVGAVTGGVGHGVGAVAKRVVGRVQGARSIGYHATRAENIEPILKSSLRESPGGRAGSGVYLSSSIDGAMAEFAAHNPGIAPAVIKVGYSPGSNAFVEGLNNPYIKGSIPLAADTLSFDSVRLPGAINTVVRNGSATVLGVAVP